jgi:hypothetical protein
VAEVIVEPVMSGVGVAVPPDEYLPEVESLCRKYGILLHEGNSRVQHPGARRRSDHGSSAGIPCSLNRLSRRGLLQSMEVCFTVAFP